MLGAGATLYTQTHSPGETLLVNESGCIPLAIALLSQEQVETFRRLAPKRFCCASMGWWLILSIMFTLEQIHELHDRLGNAETLTLYLQALNAIGVDTFDSFITDGHSEFFGKDGQK